MTPAAGGPLVIGVDGGATSTRMVLADRRGGVLARTRGGTGLLGAGKDEVVADTIARMARELVSGLGGALPVEAACAGLAGAGSEEARVLLAMRLREWGVARRARVVTDAEVAFVDAFGEGPGILLIAGTGSVALARRERGSELKRVGGWGALLGDEGSGYRVGLEGLQAGIRAAEGRGPATALTEALFAQTGTDSFAKLLTWSRNTGKSGIASLAPTVARIADEGDAVAEELVERAVAALVDHARILAKDLGPGPPPPVALVGGLIEEGGSLRLRLLRAMELAGLHPLRRPVDPARGAVRVALSI
jgi:N-acetylglucosamine kinase-like BadF-type ATPase